MKTKRIILAIAAAMLACAVVYVAVYTRGDHRNVDTAKLMLALQRFSSEKRATGVPLPRQISIRELVSLGYLEEKDVHGFKGMDVVISIDIDESNPRQVLLRARLPDGTVEAVMGDGSVQHLR